MSTLWQQSLICKMYSKIQRHTDEKILWLWTSSSTLPTKIFAVSTIFRTSTLVTLLTMWIHSKLCDNLTLSYSMYTQHDYLLCHKQHVHTSWSPAVSQTACTHSMITCTHSMITCCATNSMYTQHDHLYTQHNHLYTQHNHLLCHKQHVHTAQSPVVSQTACSYSMITCTHSMMCDIFWHFPHHRQHMKTPLLAVIIPLLLQHKQHVHIARSPVHTAQSPVHIA